ncbi:MAG TPA: hypothetical protein VJB94_03555 [Candidatus Nanoarchaeia archaeon]|nr:hypothetical protein [Candidatus Nanoarchaeia archaeon]
MKLELHPNKSKIINLDKGINFLGFRIFYYHKLLRKVNKRKLLKRMKKYKDLYDSKKIDYDKIYCSFCGWKGYAKNANTFNLRKEVIKFLDKYFPGEISTGELNKYLKL